MHMGKLLGQPYKYYWNNLTSILFMGEYSRENDCFEHLPGESSPWKVNTQRMGSQLGQFVPGHLVYSDVSYPYNYPIQVVYHIVSFKV